MTEISPRLVKDLRERSGVGMSKCKEALIEADGDIQKAADILRKKGLASAVKKEGRSTREGIVCVFETNDNVALLEINTETDFVAKNEKFQKLANELTEQAAMSLPQGVEEFLKENYNIDPSLTIDEYRNLLIQSLGENIQIPRLRIISKKDKASYGIYSHMNGKIVAVVEVLGSSDEAKIARDIAMHVAADDPQYLSKKDIPQDVRRKEEEIAASQIKGMPKEVAEKILACKIKDFADGICLLNQKYVKDQEVTVLQVVKNRSAEIHCELKINCFWRWKVGESV